MKLTNWQPEVQDAIQKLLKSPEPHRAAVFDADGTLWYDDLGEAFFHHQVNNRLAPGLKGIEDPWAYYKSHECKDHTGTYGWLAQINSGLKLSELRAQAHDFYKNHFKTRANPAMVELIQNLKKNNFEVWVCTASIRWAIEPALEELGIPLDRLIGVEVHVDENQCLTKDLIMPLPYIAGKRFWVEKKLPAPPLLVAGNSIGDVEMLKVAKELPLVIIHLPHLARIQSSEEQLMAEAKSRGWPIQTFTLSQ